MNNKAVTTSSTYIKLPHWALGSVRVGDHRGREKYRYRWELRLDVPPDTWEEYEDRGVVRLRFGSGMLEEFVLEFEKQAAERGVERGARETWQDYLARRGKERAG